MMHALTNNLRVLCWVWIVCSTIVILFHAPVTVTRKGYTSSDFQVTSTEWIGPFTQPLKAYRVTRSSIDFSRLVVVLLTMNFLPAVMLWRHDEVVGWLERQQRQRAKIDRVAKNGIVTRARTRREVLFSLCVVGLVVLSTIGLLALGFFNNSKQRTSAESAVPQDAAVTKSQTPKTPPSPATSQETGSPPLPTPTPLDPAPVVLEQPKPTPLESDSQNLRPDASLPEAKVPEAKAIYRISGVRAGDFLNMRQGPGISYPVIQRLQNGVDGVTLIGNPTGSGKKKWQKINSRGVVGWVNADYLTSSSDSQNTKAVAPNANGR
jgi:hypothetical protein